MSRIKEELLRQQDAEMECFFKLMDFVYENLEDAKLTVEELDQMEEGHQPSNHLPSNETESIPYFPLNNTNYNPLQGA